jgi:hypothetical protein
MERLEIAQSEQSKTNVVDFEKIEAVIQSGWREIYNALDDEHKRAFWRDFVSSIEVEWHGDVKRIKQVDFF